VSEVPLYGLPSCPDFRAQRDRFRFRLKNQFLFKSVPFPVFFWVDTFNFRTLNAQDTLVNVLPVQDAHSRKLDGGSPLRDGRGGYLKRARCQHVEIVNCAFRCVRCLGSLRRTQINARIGRNVTRIQSMIVCIALNRDQYRKKLKGCRLFFRACGVERLWAFNFVEDLGFRLSTPLLLGRFNSSFGGIP